MKLFWEVFIIRITNVFLCDGSLTCPYAPMELAKGRIETGSKTTAGATSGHTECIDRAKRSH